jgi:seryl-tRNA synthetase
MCRQLLMEKNMLDIALIRQAPEVFDQNIARRGLPPHADRILALDEQVRTLITQINTLQTQRNQASQQFRDADDTEVVKARVVTLKAEIEKLEQQRQEIGNELHHLLITLPNMLMPEVPDGQSDADNFEIRRWGTPRIFTFPPKEHFDIGEQRQEMDFETAVKLSGSRFVVLKNGLARLHRALGQFMLDLHVYEHGFEEIDVPLMMRLESMAATTHLPKFDNGFRTEDGYWLIPSAEVPLINLYRDMILEPEQLPIRMAALTPCFRSEAGSAGRDTRGMLRHHQFYKVELVTITHPDRWKEDFDYTVHCAEKVLQKLNLPYRLMQLCAGDCATKEAYAIDPEVWLPGQNRYREISTWACTTDYQSRRAQIRIKDGNKKIHPYVIYGSGTAVGRALIAVIENYQQENGKIKIPDVLIPYMRGVTEI